MKQFIIFCVALGFILALGVIAGNYWFQKAISQPNGNTRANIIFEVSEGTSLEVLAEKLHEQGLVKEKEAFILYGKLNPELASGIQAGYFEISPDNSIIRMFEILQKAKNKEDMRVTIPEGLRFDEVAEILARAFSKVPGSSFFKEDYLKIVAEPDDKALSSTARDFLKTYKPAGKSLEGYLYPETYFLDKDSDAAAVISKQLETLSAKFTREDLSAIETGNYKFYELLTLGSMIEREALEISEEPMIADVLIKRLEGGLDGSKLLMVDAALLYPVKDWKADILSLKAVPGPYNTYLNPGLPPTPISNPGIDAILAALYPEPNEFFYYLHDRTGKIYFAPSYEEHLNNINKYL